MRCGGANLWHHIPVKKRTKKDEGKKKANHGDAPIRRGTGRLPPPAFTARGPGRQRDPGRRTGKGTSTKQTRGRANQNPAQIEGTKEDGGKQ